MSILFSDRLLLARTQRGLKREQVALCLDVTAQTIWAWERGKREPSIVFLRQLVALLDISLDWLVGASDEEPDWSAKRKDADRRRLDADIAASMMVTDVVSADASCDENAPRDGAEDASGSRSDAAPDPLPRRPNETQ